MIKILAPVYIRITLWLALLSCSASSSLADAPASQPAMESVARQTRKDFLALIDRPRVAPAAEEKLLRVQGPDTFQRFSYLSEAGQRVPGLLLARTHLLHDSGRHPVVIVLHGTGGRKEAEMATLHAMADQNFLALSIDARFHGERGNQTDYNAAIAGAFDDGKSHPLYLDTVWDVMRLVDYLQTRSDVDASRIGLMGISKGGIETWLTAAIDTRIAAAVPCISVQSFKWGLENDGWHGRIGTVQKGFDAAATAHGLTAPDAAFVRQFYDHLLPGIYGPFDGPQMLPMIAPRPLLVISGDKDPINPVQGLRLCEATTGPAYERLGASDKFKVILQPNTGHAVNASARDEAVRWFVKWIGDAQASTTRPGAMDFRPASTTQPVGQL